MMKRNFHLFLLVLTVFLAGCVGQPSGGPAAGTSGVIIKSFSSDLKETEPGVPIILSLLVKNVGAKQATSVSTELIGLTSEWTISPDRTQTISDLSPPDPDRGITEGQEDFKTWTLTGPAKNTKLSYDANVRVYYTYETVSETLFRIVTYDYFRQANDRGGVQISKTTGGPLSVTFKAPNTVISSNEVSIQFEIQNSGGGRAYKSDTKPTTANLDIVSVSVSGTKDCTTARDVRLIDGKTGRLYCKVSTAGVSNFEDKTVVATIRYRYYVESSTSISVLPSVEGVTPGVPGVPGVTPTPSGEGTWLFKLFQTQDERDVGTSGKYKIEYISASSSQHRFRVTNKNNNNVCDTILEHSKPSSIKVEKEAASEFCSSGVELTLTPQVTDLSIKPDVKCTKCFQVYLTAEDSQGKSTTYNLALLPTIADFTQYKIELTECTGSFSTAKMTVSNSATKQIEMKQGDQATVSGILTQGIFVNLKELIGKGTEPIWNQIPTVSDMLCRARVVSQIGTPIV